jgi:hypothetical protein
MLFVALIWIISNQPYVAMPYDFSIFSWGLDSAKQGQIHFTSLRAS